MKKFNYFGQSVTAPDYAKYIATDADGEVWWYAGKSIAVGLTWDARGVNCDRVRNDQYIKNWRRSLRECR